MDRRKCIQMENGDGIAVKNGRVFKFTCCDCALTHDIEPRIVGRECTLFMQRNERCTSQKRRRIKERRDQGG